MEPVDKEQVPKDGWRTFLVLWGTQSLSQFGTQVTFFAITLWLVQVLYPNPEQRGELALALAAEGIAFTTSGLLAAPFAGAWADRHDRRLTMIATDLGSGLLTLVLVALLLTQTLQLWMWIIIVIGLSVLSAFHGSAFSASYVSLLPSNQLPRANGMVQTAIALTGIFAPVVAATMVALPELLRQRGSTGSTEGWLSGLPDGTSLAVAIDAATYFIAGLAAILISIPKLERTDLRDEKGKIKKSVRTDIKEGIVYLWRRPSLLWLLSLFTAANLLLFPSVLIPLVVKFDLAADWHSNGLTYEAALALLMTTVGIAGVVWGTVVTVWGGLRKRRVYAVILPLLMAGLLQVGLGLSPSLYLSAALIFALIGMGVVMGMHMAAILQTQTPRELQGRVSAVRRVIVQSGGPVGTALAGWLAGIFDPGLLLASFGALLAAYCVAQLFNTQLLKVEGA
jgi:MFS family permease